jgi:hypothetical protein
MIFKLTSGKSSGGKNSIGPPVANFNNDKSSDLIRGLTRALKIKNNHYNQY